MKFIIAPHEVGEEVLTHPPSNSVRADGAPKHFASFTLDSGRDWIKVRTSENPRGYIAIRARDGKHL